MLRTLNAPPKKGSLRESALILLLMKLENIEHAKFRAQAQIFMDQEKGVEAFEEYMKIAFPYLESVKQREKSDHIKALEQWVKKGPMKVTPMLAPKMRSRMKQKIVSTESRRGLGKGSDKLYEKLGNALPI